MKNCVSTAPARADRGSDLPEKLTKAQKKNNLPTNTPTLPIFLQKVRQNITPKSMKISPRDHHPDPVSPNPLFKKLTLSHCNSNHSGSAFRHLVLGPHVSFHGPLGCSKADKIVLRAGKWRQQVCQMTGFGHPKRSNSCPKE